MNFRFWNLVFEVTWPPRSHDENTTFENFNFEVTWPLKVTCPQKCKLAIISETVRNRAKQSEFSNPVGLLSMKLHEVTWPLQVTWPRKCKWAVISETLIDRAKKGEFSTPVALVPRKLPILKISILRSHDPWRSQHQMFVYL